MSICSNASRSWRGAKVPERPQPMLTGFFLELKAARVPVSVKEYLMLMEAMDKGLAAYRIDDFYYLSRAALVKDERHLDR